MNAAVMEVREPSARYLVRHKPTLISSFDVMTGASAGIAKLRASILSLAVQGKLVGQSAGDEPASALLVQISTEKNRLVFSGMIKSEPCLSGSHIRTLSVVPRRVRNTLPVAYLVCEPDRQGPNVEMVDQRGHPPSYPAVGRWQLLARFAPS